MNVTKKDTFINNCLNDLRLQEANLTRTEYRYAEQTILAIQILMTKKDEIASFLDETDRNLKITQMTQLIAEPGLVPGTSQEEIEQSIIARVELLRTAYLKDKEKNETFLLYRMGFVGPPCFNGRLITLQHYVYQRHGIKTDLFYEFRTDIDSAAIQLEEIMYQYLDSHPTDSSSSPTLEQLQTFAEEQPKVFSDLSFSMNSTNIQAIYKRASNFYTGV